MDTAIPLCFVWKSRANSVCIEEKSTMYQVITFLFYFQLSSKVMEEMARVLYNTKRLTKCQVCYIYSPVFLVMSKSLAFTLDIVGPSTQRDVVVATTSREGKFTIEKLNC